MNFKLVLLPAVVAGGAYCWYTQNPGVFGGAASRGMSTFSTDASHAESKVKNYR